jgi:hypothetical protein
MGYDPHSLSLCQFLALLEQNVYFQSIVVEFSLHLTDMSGSGTVFVVCWKVKEYLWCIVKVELIGVQQSISVLPLIRVLWLFTVRHRNGTLEMEASSFFSLSATLQDFSSKCA